MELLVGAVLLPVVLGIAAVFRRRGRRRGNGPEDVHHQLPDAPLDRGAPTAADARGAVNRASWMLGGGGGGGGG